MLKRFWFLAVAAIVAFGLVMLAVSRESVARQAPDPSTPSLREETRPQIREPSLDIPSPDSALVRAAETVSPRAPTLSPEHAEPRPDSRARGATLDARVIEADGRPLSSAHVLLAVEPEDVERLSAQSSKRSDRAQWLRWNAETDSDGRCVLEDLPSDVRLQASVSRAPNAAAVMETTLTLGTGELRRCEWRLESPAQLSGLVLDQDEHPVADLELFLERPLPGLTPEFQIYGASAPVARARTDESGRFAMTFVPSGSWWLGPEPPGGPNDNTRTVAGLAITVELAAGESRMDLVLRVQRSLFIRGRVLEPSGAPAAGQWVRAKQSDMVPVSAVSLADGSFALGPLRVGRYEVYAGGAGGSSGNAFLALSDLVIAEAGEEGLVLALKLGGSISGRVIDRRTGAGVVGQVWLSPRNATVFLMAEGTSTEDGSFHFEHLDAGTYDIGVQAGNALCGLVKGIVVEPSLVTKNVDIRLDPAATLRVRYAGICERASVSVKVDGQRVPGGGLVARGATANQVVPAGRSSLEVYLWGKGLLPEQSIEVSPGEVRELVIDDPP